MKVRIDQETKTKKMILYIRSYQEKLNNNLTVAQASEYRVLLIKMYVQYIYRSRI